MAERHPDAVHPDPLERRQLWARDRRLPCDAPLVRIRRGEAGRYRDDCQTGYLICPIPECVDPRLIARGGRHRHDHFAHRPGHGGHAPETLAHRAGKHLVAGWLRAQPGVTDVTLEGSDRESGARPDVAARLADGRVVAFEIQYAALSEAEWRRRHERYRDAAVIDVWLWGHERRWVDKSPDRHWCSLASLLVVLDDEIDIRFIDPATEELLAPRYEQFDPIGRPSRLWRSPLSEARFVDGRVIAPFDAMEARRAEIHSARAAAQAAQRADEERRAAERVARQQLRAEQDAEFRRALGMHRYDAAWREYLYPRASWIGGHACGVIKSRTTLDDQISLRPEHWRALVFERSLNGRLGAEVSIRSMAQVLAPIAGWELAHEATVEFAGVLIVHGYLGVTDRSKSEGVFIVLGDAFDPPRRDRGIRGV